MAWTGFASLSIFLLAPYFQWFGRWVTLRGLHTTAAIPQLVIPTAAAVLLPAWIYHHRKRLRLDWIFTSPV
jgi:hypothetical protein